ncbi:MAG: protein kinase, partial [Planctomycetes bacterium]|nr:protein kinase [Planctomycetota bacterium]
MDHADEPAANGEQYSSGNDFDRLATRFESLRQLPPAERHQALAALEHEDPHLTTLLRRLFEQHSDDPEELAAPEKAFGAADLVGAVAEAGAALPLPDRIGPYVPRRELGRGGMGTVYLAERQGGDFTQTVAVKLLRAAVDDLDLQRRFRTERRILAGLQHPNIATMFDGGTTDAGQPYVAME